MRDDIGSTLRLIQGNAESMGGASALEHLSHVLDTGSAASYLRREQAERGSSEGMVDAAIARFREGVKRA